MLIGKYNKSLIITYIGVAFAICGMNFAFGNDLRNTMICLVIAGVCDLFDGKVARKCKRTEEEKLYGIQIDSLADMVGFVVFPVVIGYSMGLTCWYHIIAYVLLVLGGITRLGYFNIMVSEKNKDVPVKKYKGLPVTSTSIILPFFWIMCEALNKVGFSSIYIVLIYIISILFVLNISIPKFKGKAYIVITFLAVAGIIIMMLL